MKHIYIVEKYEEGLRIDDFAYQHSFNKKFLKDIKMKGEILVNGIHQTVRYQLSEGEVIEFIPPQEENNLLKENIPFSIAYEDEYLLVVDKPKGLPTIPSRHYPSQTLANALSYYYQQIHLSSTIHVINRLDRETSGLMMIGKYREIHDMMSSNINHIYRKYCAHVVGNVSSSQTISLPIYRKNKEMRRVIDEKGKPSITHCFPIESNEDVSFVSFLLETGRTHQIRVHMAAIQHPLVGDELYGDGVGNFDLTSMMIAFVHPITQRIITIRKK